MLPVYNSYSTELNTLYEIYEPVTGQFFIVAFNIKIDVHADKPHSVHFYIPEFMSAHRNCCVAVCMYVYGSFFCYQFLRIILLADDLI